MERSQKKVAVVTGASPGIGPFIDFEGWARSRRVYVGSHTLDYTY